MNYHVNVFISQASWPEPEGPYHGYDSEVNFNCAISTSLDSFYEVDNIGDDYLLRLPRINFTFDEVPYGYVRLGSGPAVPPWSGDDYHRTFSIDPILARPPSNSGFDFRDVNDRPENVSRFLGSPGPLYTVKKTRLSAFQEAIMDDFHHIRASSIKSFSAAVGNYENALKSNNLEVIAEYSQLLQILPDIAEMAAFFSLLKQGRFIDALDSLIDLLTGTHLLVEFGIKPTSAAADEFVKSLSTLKHRLTNAGNRRTVYGSFEYVFDPDVFYPKTKLVTRSKVVMSSGESAIAGTLMASAALGVQPGLSNWWDTVLLSFVIDWWLKLGDRLSNIDAYIKAFIYEIDYCVHSYSIISEVEDDDLANYDIVSNRLEPISLSFYRRELSMYPPPLRDSKFDFDAPKSTPNLGIVGSLVYQLTR